MKETNGLLNLELILENLSNKNESIRMNAMLCLKQQAKKSVIIEQMQWDKFSETIFSKLIHIVRHGSQDEIIQALKTITLICILLREKLICGYEELAKLFKLKYSEGRLLITCAYLHALSAAVIFTLQDPREHANEILDMLGEIIQRRMTYESRVLDLNDVQIATDGCNVGDDMADIGSFTLTKKKN
jgi:hypothetical protein